MDFGDHWIESRNTLEVKLKPVDRFSIRDVLVIQDDMESDLYN